MKLNFQTGIKSIALRPFFCFSCFAVSISIACAGSAQEDFPPISTFDASSVGHASSAQDETTSDQALVADDVELALEEQKKLVNAIYNATKSAKTEKNYTAFLAQCNEALAKKLSPQNRDYVNSLIGWALNRRGEKRFELAIQLKSIENLQHVQMMELALKDFDQAVIADPNRHRTWMSRGIAQVENGNYDLAIADFTKVIKLKPDESNGWFNRAEALYQRSNPANFTKVSSKDETSEVLSDENLKMQKLGYEQAVADYDVVLRLNSNDLQALTGRGHAKFAFGDYAGALADYEQVTKLVPNNATAFVNLGDVHQRLGNWTSAQADYEKALSIEKTGVTCQRAAWFKATCPDESFLDATEALNLVNRAIELVGDTATNLDTLAAAEAATGNFEVAKKTQLKVIGLVNAEISLEANQYQARLALYEKGQPFTQTKQKPPTPAETEK